MANDGTDPERRFFVTAATTVVDGVGIAFGAVPFMASFQPSERTCAIGAPIEADISKIEPGQRLVFESRGKLMWVVSRTAESIPNEFEAPAYSL